MKKISMKNPIVEMDGDEMTRIIWQQIKQIVLLPYLDLNTLYYDLGLQNREKTGDQVTIDAAQATLKHRVAVKCATITPNAQRVKEYSLSNIWKSPNGTIRAILDGTVFRTPIMTKSIQPFISTWKKPITIARHAYGDVYKDVEMKIDEPALAELLITFRDGRTQKKIIHNFEGKGVILGMHNLDQSIISYAKACFEYALEVRQDIWFATKDTISKIYDHHFKDIFDLIYQTEYQEKFNSLGLRYFYTLIDDAVARIIRSDGGIIWACKNYDGDVMSDMVASAYGSLAMMTSVLVSPNGVFEYEAAHGTVTRHYYKYLNGEKTSTNPMATLFAWTGALYKRGELDHNSELMAFSKAVEDSAVYTIDSGTITGDLNGLMRLETVRIVDTEEFLRTVVLNIADISTVKPKA